MVKKKALIIGISGQDGCFLAQYLLSKQYEVYGTSRDVEQSSFSNLKQLGIYQQVKLFSMSLIDFRSVFQVVSEVAPDEIYNLGGQTSVGLSFTLPVETYESISMGTLNILEVLRITKNTIKFYNASSSECFGEADINGSNEQTQFKPRSPYGIAKSTAFWQVANYREAYHVFACSGILFNHESYLRPKRFVTRKIILAAIGIAQKRTDTFTVGNIDISRDWGWAPEYVEAMHLMLQQEQPEDFAIATGVSITLREAIDYIFNYFGLNYQSHIQFDAAFFRPTDIIFSKGNPQKAADILHWQAQTKGLDVFKKMIEHELQSFSK